MPAHNNNNNGVTSVKPVSLRYRRFFFTKTHIATQLRDRL